jgi:hypothetical protein
MQKVEFSITSGMGVRRDIPDGVLLVPRHPLDGILRAPSSEPGRQADDPDGASRVVAL